MLFSPFPSFFGTLWGILCATFLHTLSQPTSSGQILTVLLVARSERAAGDRRDGHHLRDGPPVLHQPLSQLRQQRQVACGTTVN